jgi:aldose sugar dehydrogenase
MNEFVLTFSHLWIFKLESRTFATMVFIISSNQYEVMMPALLLLLIIILISIFTTAAAAAQDKTEENFQKSCRTPTCEHPLVRDPDLEIKLLSQLNFKFEPNQLSPVSTMTFLGNDILILNKNDGIVYKLKNGTMLDAQLLDVNVANELERGLLGIAYYKDNNSVNNIFLYLTETQHNDGTDICPNHGYCEPLGNAIGNRVYRYLLENNKLVNPKVLLDLPAGPGPTHNGGVIKIGPDKNLYVTIGDLNGYFNGSSSTKAQNFKNGSSPDGRAGILRITQDGDAVGNGILGKEFPVSLYYAYGIRNSFGIDFDPITGNLWDTEDGPEFGDEINLVNPGFNSGWNKVQGIWKPIEAKDPNLDLIAGDELLYPKELTDFGGSGKYSAPKFIWNDTVGVTAIKFLNSDKLGKKYENDLFVGCVNLGTIFHFDLNKDRSGLKLDGLLKDKIANNLQEMQNITFSKGLGQITDIKVGPDGYMYVLSKYMDKATIFRIAPRVQ